MLSVFNTFPAPAFGRLDREFDRLVRDLAGPFPARPGSDVRALAAATEIFETESGLRIRVDLPGVQPNDVKVEYDKGVLTVRAERKAETEATKGTWHVRERASGVFARSFELPDTFDRDRITARYEHGVLTLELPRRDEAKPRTIEVKVGG